MRNTLAIAGKEVRTYLTTWVAYVLSGAFMFLTALVFVLLVDDYRNRMLMAEQQAQWALERFNLTDMVMGPVFGNTSVFFLIMLPMLTMGLLAEERKSKTLELLMTAPVRPFEIVLGKYLGVLVVMSAMLAMTALFPLLLELFGGAEGTSALDWGTIGASYLGLFLMGAGMLAVGMLASAATESQVVAVVVSFAVLIFFWFIGFTAQGEQGFWPKVAQHVALTSHLQDFLRGVIKLSDVAYYLSLAFAGLFLTHRVVEAQRWR